VCNHVRLRSSRPWAYCRRCIRQREATDPVQLCQRTSQRRFPIFAGPSQGFERRDRIVWRRDLRGSTTQRPPFGGDGELPSLARPHGGFRELEPDPESGDQPTALPRSGATALCSRDLVGRPAFAGILLSTPRALFRDESTSALDEELEQMLYHLIRAELPEMILISVSHRATVEQLHARQLQLIGDGAWRLE
jgi:hypothetical protein